jgi:hypothetical protein
MTTPTAAQLYNELTERYQRIDFDRFRQALLENEDVDDINRDLGDLGEFLDRVIDPEMESDFRGFTSLAPDQLELRRGRQGFADLWRTFVEPWSDFQIRDSRALELDPEHAISSATWHLRGQESGIELDIVQAGLWTSRGDRLVRLQAFASVEEARAAAQEQGLPIPD